MPQREAPRTRATAVVMATTTCSLSNERSAGRHSGRGLMVNAADTHNQVLKKSSTNTDTRPPC